MQAFADLYSRLDETTKTTEKVRALVDYFRGVPPEEAIWAVYFLCGRKVKQLVPTRKLRDWLLAKTQISEWLYEECYDSVGDVAETIALLLPESTAASDLPLNYWVEEKLLPLKKADEAGKRAAVEEAWDRLDEKQRFVWNKLITGSFRVGVSQQLVTRALAEASGLEVGVIAHRLMGEWPTTPEFYRHLLEPDSNAADDSRPYPFCLAHPLEEDPSTLGDIAEWQAEWKWDGIRSQLIRRRGRTFLWTRGEELVTDRYPELRALGDSLPEGTVLDGEILAWKEGVVLPFARLQKRIGRKTVGKKLLEEIPVILMAYDLLELDGIDLRDKAYTERRAELERLVLSLNPTPGFEGLQASPLVEAESWEQVALRRGESRSLQVEGLMLKRRTSAYRVGRVRGDWWKWKVSPFTIDAVLIYAQKGSGKRADLYTDYTFGVWDGDKLVPVAKAYSGLTDAEIREVDDFVKRNTLERFGPVRTVKAELVFELAFEGIQESGRHKSGIAVRFPRILRWRTDKKPKDADRLEEIKKLVRSGAVPPAEEPPVRG
jgi:DNA ligase 1